MLVRYKRNKKYACYDSDSLPSEGKSESIQRLYGPFASCGDCPYASHGFLCYSAEGDCMKTDMQRLNNRRKETLKNNEKEAQKP